MAVLLHFLIVILANTACALFNESGAFTTSTKRKILGTVSHVGAIALSVSLYGNMRGLFVYTGVIALFGMVFIFYKQQPVRKTK